MRVTAEAEVFVVSKWYSIRIEGRGLIPIREASCYLITQVNVGPGWAAPAPLDRADSRKRDGR